MSLPSPQNTSKSPRGARNYHFTIRQVTSVREILKVNQGPYTLRACFDLSRDAILSRINIILNLATNDSGLGA